jgi:hypothetical protein
VTAAREARRVPAIESQRATTDIIVVSEDPYFIEEANAVLSRVGARVIGCLGPAHTDCDLYDKRLCALAGHAAIAIVDSPRSGTFRYHTVEYASGEYAEALQRRHPEAHVILWGAPVGGAGPTGEIATTETRRQALSVLTRLLRVGGESASARSTGSIKEALVRARRQPTLTGLD